MGRKDMKKGGRAEKFDVWLKEEKEAHLRNDSYI